MQNPKPGPYNGPTKLVLAFNIGTTFSSISYCILERGQVPDVRVVTRFPGQRLEMGDTKVPSIVYYDKIGNARAAGAEVFTESVVQSALEEEWTKFERWMLHLCPAHLAPYIDATGLPPFPSGKSTTDILADFIKYLFHSAKTFIQELHPSFPWSSAEDSIEYIFTHPNGWEDVRWLYCQAIERAGLIPRTPAGRSRVHTLTKGEASLHFCIADILDEGTPSQASPQGVVVIYAGRDSIDLSMFSVTLNPTSYEELAPPACRPQGSVFVTRRARALLEEKLGGCENSAPDMIAEATRNFDTTLKFIIRSDRSPVFFRVGGLRTSIPKYNILNGKLKLTGEEATSVFNPTINAIIDVFEHQQKSAKIPITMAFLVGELSKNDWVWSRLQSYFMDRNIRIHRLHLYTERVVTMGAVSSYIDRMTESKDEEGGISRLEKTTSEPRTSRIKSAHAGVKKDLLHSIHGAQEQKNLCEILFAQGRINDAVASLLEIANDAAGNDESLNEWLTEFTHRCASALETTGDEASTIGKHDEAIAAYSTALSLGHSAPKALLNKWARMMLIHGPAETALVAAVNFKLPKFVIFQVICDILEGNGRVLEAITCLRQMESKLAGDTGPCDEQTQWRPDFQQRCVKRLEDFGDTAVDSQNYSEAIEHFSTILTLNPTNRVDILLKRSNARTLMNSWEDALKDADDIVGLAPSSYRGYEMRYAALHGTGRHTEAIEAFNTMLSKLEESPEVNTRQLHHRYVKVINATRNIVQQTISKLPRIIIDTTTGRLYNKTQQAEAFETLPIYGELAMSMSIPVDFARIRKAVGEFYRYVMLSHKWEKDEPLLQKVENISVYDLEPSLANIKLQKFCLLVRHLGFRWAWSDTCCVDKLSNVVLQESLVAMFMWYNGSSLTIVYLRDVSSLSQQPGDLRQSIWNTRAWTYQEYVAAEIIQFYTEDWKPYLGLTLLNHKESPEIISEMQQETGVSAQDMLILRPGLNMARHKLYLASRRETTLVEDIAYSLFGIFKMSIPIIYGERYFAVGRFLEHILTGSGDVTILAWTGNVGNYNSCLPMDLTVYNSVVPLHIPRPMENAEMEGVVMALQSSLDDISLAATLCNQLNALPSPSLTATRLKLPGILFPLTIPVDAQEPELDLGMNEMQLHVYHATSPAFADMEIKTADDLAGMEGLYLIHPWIRPLLDQEFPHGAATLNKVTFKQALRFVARLREPFGALLFEAVSRVEYRRVAADCLIMTQFRKELSLTELIDGIHTIEVQ